MSFITRPFYCDCYHHGATQYVVWGGTRQTLVLYPIELNIIANITPHIVSFKQNPDGNIAIHCSCGIIGCGVDFIDYSCKEKGIQFLTVKHKVISPKEFKSLLSFKDTGYEISKFKRTCYAPYPI